MFPLLFCSVAQLGGTGGALGAGGLPGGLPGGIGTGGLAGIGLGATLLPAGGMGRTGGVPSGGVGGLPGGGLGPATGTGGINSCCI